MKHWPHHEVDEELRQVFADLLDLGYSERRVQRLMSKIILGRNHQDYVFNLCQLVRVLTLSNSKEGLADCLDFFFHDDAHRAGWAEGYFHKTANDMPRSKIAGVTVTERDVRLSYPDSRSQVSVGYGEVRNSIVFFSFLTSTLSFHRLDELLNPLNGKDLTYRDVQDVANAVSRELYAYLADHTNPVQEAKNLETIVSFLKAQRGDDDFSEDDLNDDMALAFWVAHSVVQDSGFVTYKNVFNLFLRLTVLMKRHAEQRAVTHARSIGYSWDDNETDVEDRAETERWDQYDPFGDADEESFRARVLEDEADPGLGLLFDWYPDESDGEDASPDEVLERLTALLAEGPKYFTDTELKQVEAIARYINICPDLLHGYLRERCFGPEQAVLTQHRRDGKGIDAASITLPHGKYLEHIRFLTRLRSKMYQQLLAANEVIRIAKEKIKQPGEPFRETAPSGAQPADTDEESDVVDLTLLRKGRSALTNTRRKGWDEIRDGDLTTQKNLYSAIIPLTRVLGWLDLMLAQFGVSKAENLGRSQPDVNCPDDWITKWSDRNERDLGIFEMQFLKIYGENG